MGADLIMVIAILKKLELLTEKEAKNLYEEIRYKNLSMSLDECLAIVGEAFKKHRIGQKPNSTSVSVGGKDISITK